MKNKNIPNERKTAAIVLFYLQEIGEDVSKENVLAAIKMRSDVRDKLTALCSKISLPNLAKNASIDKIIDQLRIKPDDIFDKIENNEELVHMILDEIKPPKYLRKILEPLDFFGDTFRKRQKHTEDLLCRYLNMKTVIGFVGAGMSIPLGYPTWGTFAEDIFLLLKIFLENDGDTDKNYLTRLYPKPDKTAAKRLAKALFKDKRYTHYKVKDNEYKNIFAGILFEEKFLEKFLRLLRKHIKFDYPAEKDLKNLQVQYKKNQVKFDELLEYARKPKNNEMDVLTVFSECERLLCITKEEWEENKQSKFFRALVRSYFHIKRVVAATKNPKIEETEFNPYLALLKLPIKKYITFNYDLELERALLYQGNIPRRSIKKEEIYGEDIKCWEIINECGEKSFAQTSDCSVQMARFSVARYEGTRNAVFHCHGRVDDPESCIVSEEDYQKWYLLEEEKEKFIPFRQTLDLTLDSNPILFIGFGLKDEDLMRVLRSITANRSFEKTRNPLFCLLYIGEHHIGSGEGAKWSREKEFEDECTALYMKYGLHVIPVKQEDYKKRHDKDIAPLCHKLLEIHDKWRNWWEGVLKKPMFREFKIDGKSTSYFHYKFEPKSQNLIKKFDDDLHTKLKNALETEKVAEKIKGRKKSAVDKKKNDVTGNENNVEDKKIFASNLAIVVGDGGTGKSWSVQSYLDLEVNKDYKKFYWSSYYGNDVLTGIDRLIRLFRPDADKNSEMTKFEWMMDIIDKTENALIVFDGIEKLLKPNKENTEGESVSPEVKKFFKIISNYNVRSKIIITTRLLPTDVFYNIDEKIRNETDSAKKEKLLTRKAAIKKDKIFSAPKCWSESLSTNTNKKDNVSITDDPTKNEQLLSSMCSLFDGHIFGISLMKAIIKTFSSEISCKREVKVRSVLRDIANTPIEKRIDRVIHEAIKVCDKNNFQNYNGIVRSFIQRISLFMHPVRKEIAQSCLDEIKKNKPRLSELLEKLVDANLVQKVRIENQTKVGQTAYVVHPLVRSYVFERMHESRFTSYPSLQLPGFTSGKEVVDPGSQKGKEVSVNLFNAMCTKAEELKKGEIASDMCRAAFSILRSRFCSNTVTRWGDYTEYTKMTLLLYDTTKKVSSKHWDYNEPTREGFDKCSELSAPLYPDELAWVYNEVGLASMSMGNNLNATALWEQGYEISKQIDKSGTGRYLFQSNINMGAIYIYYGKLNIARDYLNKAFEIANKLENKKLSDRVAGYIALVKYLRGNLEEAHNDFEEACKGLSQNPRARAVFMNYHGELLLKLNKQDMALEKIEQSRHLAESEYYPDLIAYARLSKANVFSRQGEHIKAQNEYQFVVKYAREKHLRRLEAATLSGMSRLSEKLGDFSTAIRLAVDSLKISNEYLLSLHQTQGLIVLGKALSNGHHHEDLGIACLKTARELAQKQEYFLRMNEAEEELAKYNITY